ncbi:MAG: hypothetical protein AB8F65_07330 [Woeseiaceae bacterium]
MTRLSGLRGISAKSALAVFGFCAAGAASAVGTPAGTDISNTASVSYDVGGTAVVQPSNTVTITVAETLDVVVVLQSPQVVVAPGDTGSALVYTGTNTGNGEETFSFLVDNTDATDDFDPLLVTPNVYFDTDASGDFSVGDVAYTPGTNDPLLAADETITIIVVNDIPAGLANGDIGRSSLQAEAATGSGTPGTVITAGGTNGVDAIVGATGAIATTVGEYIVSDVAVAFNKSSVVTDPYGGAQPVPGATIVYTITIEVTGTGTATGLQVVDPIPANTTFVAGSITLNGVSLTDQADGDVGVFDDAGVAPEIRVVVGDIDAAAGLQTVEFSVLID